MTMKVAGRVVLFLLGTIASTTQAQPYGSWRGDTFWGRQLSCDEGQALVAACGSGQDKDCRLWGGQELTHKIRCVGKPTQDLMWHNQGSTKQTIKKDWGEWAFCAPNQVAVARCSGGGSRDCDGVSHTLTCVDVSSTARIRLDSLDTKRVCVDHGVDASCPVGYVVTGSCGSGKNGDVRNGTVVRLLSKLVRKLSHSNLSIKTLSLSISFSLHFFFRPAYVTFQIDIV